MKSPLPSCLQGAVDEFIGWRESRKTRYRFEVQPFFHYTGANGLIGIIKSNTLWLTHADHLNDPSEFHLCHNMACKALRDAQEQETSDSLVRLFLDGMSNCLDESLYHISRYVGSFSRQEDDLGQWRSYADNGRGFCLAISQQVSVESHLDEDPLKNPFLIAVRYDPELAGQELQEGLQKTLELLRRGEIRETCEKTSNVWKSFLIQLSVALAHWIYFICVAFKHPAYAAEQEVRLLLINAAARLQPHERVRTRNGKIVPYIPWPFQPSLREKGVLQLIRIGPSAPEDAEDGLTGLLRSCGMASAPVKICRSQIPYRTI